MAETIKGLNIKLGLDATELNQELTKLKSCLKEQESDLKAINAKLKYDPTNVNLWKEKQDKLNSTLEITKQKIETKNKKLEEAKKSLEVGAISEAEFNKIRRSVSYTEADVSKLNQELEKTSSKINALGNAINEEEAEIVRRIYRLFLREGKSYTCIAEILKKEEVPTPSKKNCNWTTANIMSILGNEKYKGDAILQKVFVEDYLEHRTKKNTGQLPKYMVENSHPTIIDKDDWNLVQEEMKKRQRFKYSYSNENPYFSKLICEDCGHFYGTKVWHSNTPYKKEILQCNFKFRKDKPQCETPNLTKEEIDAMFVRGYNEAMVDKDALIQDTQELIELLTNTESIDAEIAEYNNELDEIQVLMENMIHENKSKVQSQEEYAKRYDQLIERFEKAKGKLDTAVSTKASKQEKAQAMSSFLKEMKSKPDVITEFDLDIWNLILDEAIVHKDKSITFKFRNGTEIDKR